MRQALSTIWKVTKGQRARYGLALAALIASGAVLYAVPLVSKAVLDVVLVTGTKAIPATSVWLVDQMGGAARVRENLWIPGLVMLAITVVAGALTHVRTRLSAGAAEAVARRLRDNLYDHMQRLTCRTLDQRPSGDLLQRCTSDVETLRNFLAGQVIEIGRAVAMLVIPLPLMFWLDWRMAIASIVLLPAIVAFSLIYFYRMRPVFTAKENAEGKMTTTITENLTGIRVVRAFARQDFERKKFEGSSGEFRDADMKLFRLLATFWASSDLLCFAQSILAVGTGLWLLAHDRVSVGTFFWFISVIGMFIWPVRMLGRILADLGKALVAIDRIREIVETPDERVDEPSDAFTAPGAGVSIEFRNVTFGFGPADGSGAAPVLDGVSFAIRAGGTLGIVGPSGAGKSTIVHLLLRFYDYDKGSILIDGRELRSIPRAAIRSIIGTVLQQPFLYSKTLKENILIKASGESGTEEAMRSAAAVASVHSSIEEFPQQYETLVGERGITLSGGQRQRVAIARSLVQDPKILILDDALSAVDTHTEAEILQSFRSRTSQHTTIVIAHRLSTLQQAEQIVVLDRGRVIQCGTHEELVARPGMYRTLWEIQTQIDDPDEREAAEVAHVH